MAAAKPYKIVLAGAFASGRTTFASQLVQAKRDMKKIPALKTHIYPLTLHTSAGTISLELYDSQLHAKGGMPDDEFFRTADAGLVFYDTTSTASYESLEPWLEALQSANTRRGSAPLPVIVVGTKIDLVGKRAVKPAEVELPHVKKLPYLEISSKANYKTKELLLGVVRALLGTGIQLTGKIEMEEASVGVDEEAAEKAMKEYVEAGK